MPYCGPVLSYWGDTGRAVAYGDLLMSKGVLTFNITRSHPDFHTARDQAVQSRRLYNALNALSRESIAYYKDKNADTWLAKEFGVLDWVHSNPYQANRYAFEKLRKIVEAHQNIVLPQKVAQHVAQALSKDMKVVLAHRKSGRRSSYPKYKRAFGSVHFTKQAISRKNPQWVIPSGWSHGVKLPNHVPLARIQAVTLVPRGKDFELIALYHKPLPEKRTLGAHKAAIDLGVDNLATIITTVPGERPKVVSGRGLKSLNQYANKKSAELQAKLDEERKNIWLKKGGENVEYPSPIESSRKKHLWAKRNRRVNHYLHSASTAIITYLLDAGVCELTIGWSDGFKQEVRIGKRGTQNFVSIPHARFRDELARKAVEAGMKVTIVEESYTSKASFMDNDPLPAYQKGRNDKYAFSGKRITRGTYRSRDGSLIHADVNGAWNILRKSNPTISGSRGIVVMPERLRFNY